MFEILRALQLERYHSREKYVKGGEGKRTLGKHTSTKYNKINNNSEKFRGRQDCCQESFRRITMHFNVLLFQCISISQCQPVLLN